MNWTKSLCVGILCLSAPAVAQDWPVVEHCDQCSLAQHAAKARSHTTGTPQRVRVYSMDLERDKLYGFDVYTESEPGFSTTFSEPVPIPSDIQAEWTLMLGYAKARRDFRAQGIDLTDRSLIDQMRTLQSDMALTNYLRDRLNYDTAQQLRGVITRIVNEFTRLFFAAPISIRTESILVVFSDGRRWYTVTWGHDENGNAVVADIQPQPGTAQDLAGNPIPDTPERFEQLLDQGGFVINGQLDLVERLVDRFVGSGGGGAGGGVIVRLISGTATIGAIEVVREEEPPPSSEE